MAKRPERKVAFTTRLPAEAARVVNALANNSKVSASEMIATLVDKALREMVLKVRSAPPSRAAARPAGAKQRDMGDVAELVLKEIKRRGGNEELEAKLEKAIDDHKAGKEKKPPEQEGNGGGRGSG